MIPRVKIIGGLGNQLFQYFFARSLSIKFKCNVELDISEFTNYKYDRHDLNLNHINLKLPLKSNRNYITDLFCNVKRDPSPYCFTSEIFDKKFFRYNGYWQSYKYFIDHWALFIKDFNFENNFKNLEIFEKITNTNSVSVHIRRGDYITNINSSKVHGNLKLDYYKTAIEYIRNYSPNPIFFFFSDDINWVKNNFSNKNFFFINNSFDQLKMPLKDLFLMKSCNHNIIANSTFSWWGAWLNDNLDKIVCVPEYWTFGVKSSETDLIPSNWNIL